MSKWRASFRASDTHTHWYTHTLVHSGTHTHTHTHARTNAHTHTAWAQTDKRTHTHTQAGTHTHGNETACLLLGGQQQTGLSRRGTRAPVSIDRLHWLRLRLHCLGAIACASGPTWQYGGQPRVLHRRRSSSVMTANYHRSSGRKGAGSFPRSLQHGYWAAKKDQGHNFFFDFGHSRFWPFW